MVLAIFCHNLNHDHNSNHANDDVYYSEIDDHNNDHDIYDDHSDDKDDNHYIYNNDHLSNNAQHLLSSYLTICCHVLIDYLLV